MASEDITSLTLNDPSAPFSTSASVTYIEESHPGTFKSRLLNLRRDGAYTDVIIKVKNAKIACHKVILAAYSDYFHTLFQSANKGDSDEIIEIHARDPKVAESVIDFLYTGRIEITTDNVRSICQTCDQLQLEHLKEAADKFMAERIEPANALGLYMMAKSYSLNMTLDAAFQCMLTKLDDILRLALESEFKELSEESMIRYISSDDLEIEDEKLVFQLVLRWMEVDKRNREPLFENIFQHIRLPFVDISYLCSVIENSPYCQTYKCLKLIGEAKTFHLLPQTKKTTVCPRTIPRKLKSKTKLVLLGGGSLDTGNNTTCWYLEKDDCEWEEMTKFPTADTFFFQACPVGKEILVTGGCSDYYGASGTRNCWVFNVLNKQWKALPSMNEPRCLHSMVCIKSDIYILGGVDGGSSDSCEMIDSKRKKWENIPSLLTPTHSSHAFVCHEKIYVVGGEESYTLNQCFDKTLNAWQKKSDVPIEIIGGSAVVLNDKVYIVGELQNVCMRYEPMCDIWTTCPMPLRVHAYPAAIAFEGKIVLSGGDTDVVEEFDPSTNEWKMSKYSLPKCLGGHCMLTVTF